MPILTTTCHCVFLNFTHSYTQKNFSFHPATYNQSQLLLDHWPRCPWYWCGFSHFVYLYWTVPFTFSVTVCALSCCPLSTVPLSLYTANTTRTLWSMHILSLLSIGHKHKKYSSLTKLKISSQSHFFFSPTCSVISISQHNSVNL